MNDMISPKYKGKIVTLNKLESMWTTLIFYDKQFGSFWPCAVVVKFRSKELSNPLLSLGIIIDTIIFLTSIFEEIRQAFS